MRHSRRSGFTLIELLVVISVILILVAIMTPVVIQIWAFVDVMNCKNNLRSMGMWFVQESLKGKYDTGGREPGDWGMAFNRMTQYSNSALGDCPSVGKNNPMDPRKNSGRWATCSYAYLGNLSPTYLCSCADWCAKQQGGGQYIWSLYWSGVDYGGLLPHTPDKALHNFKSLPLADNLSWKSDKSDTGEGTQGPKTPQPTIPDHQDTAPFHSADIVKFDSDLALREIPVTPADARGSVPLMMDIVVFKPSDASLLPATTVTSWKATNLNISDTNKNQVLYANHCKSSATTKKDWGINIFYLNGSVQWKKWEDLRFQVMSKDSAIDSGAYHCYFF